MKNKEIIGMVHLKALPGSPKNEYSLDEITEFAKKDLINLQENGISKAIVENFFDTPYMTELSLETIVSYTYIYSRLKQISTIPLGVNLQLTNGVEEIVIATLVDADFIRVETLLENRVSSAGIQKPIGPQLLRKKRDMNSNVKVITDVHVKHSAGLVDIDTNELLVELNQADINGIIITGQVTGEAPTAKELKRIKDLYPELKLYIGSGFNTNNAEELLQYADGAIVGTGLKRHGDVRNSVDPTNVKNLTSILK